jgi:imidazolonepropionase
MIAFREIKELVTLQGAHKKRGRFIQYEDLSVITNAAMVVDQGRILWLGSDKSFRRQASGFRKAVREISLKGLTVLPGFIDSHTHLVFAGQRYEEFEMRNQGVSYQEIAALGGGILSSMKATREICKKQLLDISQKRVDAFLRQGITTLEIKSGYSLNLKDELKQLEVISQLQGPSCVPTFLGAHALPPEFKQMGYDKYLQFLSEKVLPKIQKKSLAKRVDIYIEKGFFSKNEGRKYLRAAQQMGFDVVIHADQLSLSGGAQLAVEIGALSADHLIFVGEKEIQKLAQSEVTALLLPAADLYMKCNYPPARSLLDAGARVALATDFNPGSSPTQDITLVGLLARLYMKMSLPEVITAFTVGGAFALGLENDRGVLSKGYRADFVASEIEWKGLFYQAGYNPIVQVFKATP